MSFVLIVNLRLCRLDQLLKLSNLEFEKLDRVLSGDLLSLKGSGELERRLELAGERLETVDNVLWDVGPWFRPMVVVVVKPCQRGFGSSRSTDLATGPTTILVFRGGFFILFIYPLQLMGDNCSDAAGVVVVTRKLLVVALFSSLGFSFALFHKLFDQLNVVLEAVVLSDEGLKEVELVSVAGEGALSLLQL
jgi:hypothetical protein